MRHLLLRAALGLCTLVASLALVLFAAAGSLRFWQAWLYLATFALCVVVITAYLAVYDRALLARRIAAGPTAEHERGQRVISGIANILFLCPRVHRLYRTAHHGADSPTDGAACPYSTSTGCPRQYGKRPSGSSHATSADIGIMMPLRSA